MICTINRDDPSADSSPPSGLVPNSSNVTVLVSSQLSGGNWKHPCQGGPFRAGKIMESSSKRSGPAFRMGRRDIKDEALEQTLETTKGLKTTCTVPQVRTARVISDFQRVSVCPSWPRRSFHLLFFHIYPSTWCPSGT